ncbi:hypothetical protein OIU85_012763 [Salix viminalis]|uniref:Pentatricopeptide repeat-containing protein n=1 Tax=Salix viminalis TaxID=40686 RepID=A0A9Q0SDU0_SALVM|nr:hypothetical protein OIU85_012763 [Salix viminalis]
MKEEGLCPNEVTFVAVLTACARAKLVEIGLELFQSMAGACKIHGAIVLGNEVGSRLLELQPHHCGQYVALSSIHAGVDRWGAAADIRTTMTEARIRKVPACSLIDCM